MDFIGKVVDGVQNLMNVNPANFSGAIDVVVTDQEDGSLMSTPFHVRYGKFQLFTSKNKKVKIYVNGEKISGVQMKLSDSGQAFFVHETSVEPENDFLEPELISDSDEEIKALDIDDLEIEESDQVLVGSPCEWSFGSGSLPGKKKSKSKKENVTEKLFFEMNIDEDEKEINDINDISNEVVNDLSEEIGIELHRSEKKDDDFVEKELSIENIQENVETGGKSPSEWSFGVGSIPERLGWKKWLSWRSGKKDLETDYYSEGSPQSTSPSENFLEFKKNYYYRSLRPSSDQLKLFNLKRGANKLIFVVDDKYLECNIFYWDNNIKIVVTDIDGTITKSDVLGHIFTVFGKDWAHPGVTSLFSNIKANGYEIIYLTSRSIGISTRTKQYLSNLIQDDKKLPLGPVLLSPDRLLHALNREVILKNPHIFKIGCLKEVQKLFSNDHNPIYAGFGNQLTDFRSYKEIGIPSSRIFTINSLGEISFVGNLNKLSYGRIDELVEQIFPPPNKTDEKWNDFQYWPSRMSISLEEIEKELN